VLQAIAVAGLAAALLAALVAGAVEKATLEAGGAVGRDTEGFAIPARYVRRFDYSADGVRRSLEASLERLGLDRVDIALIHDPDDHTAEALDGAYPALARLRADGTVGAIGVGVNSVSVAEWFIARCDLDCVLVAGRYTLLDDSAAASLFPLCLARGVQVLAAGVFNSGILADPADGARFDYAPAAPEMLARARRIAEVCARYDVPVAAAALRCLLPHPAVTAAVAEAEQRWGGLDAAVAAAGVVPV